MRKHTPGPWKVSGLYGHLKDEITANDGSKAVTTVWTRQFDRDKDAPYISTTPDPEGEANARLIAAAPELLEACISLVSKLDCIAGMGLLDSQVLAQSPAVEQIHAAIAKATT